MGVIRHADAGMSIALDYAERFDLDLKKRIEREEKE
jgi:urocanate hydratase